jgi:DNA-binding GntR family transcriptional regulator
MQENYRDLCDIVSALEKQQATAVRSLMRGHVRRFTRYMNSQETTGKPTDNQGEQP